MGRTYKSKSNVHEAYFQFLDRVFPKSEMTKTLQQPPSIPFRGHCGFQANPRPKKHQEPPFQANPRPTVLKFPWFNGTDVHEWISQSNIYFQSMKTPLHLKVKIASQHLWGDALKWYEFKLRNRNDLVWLWFDFEISVVTRFSPERNADLMVELSNLKQTRGVESPVSQFNATYNKVEVCDSYGKGLSLVGLKLELVHYKVFSPSSFASISSVVESQTIDKDVEGGNMNKELGINEGDVGTAACIIDENNLLISKGDAEVEEGSTCTEVLGQQSIDSVARDSAHQVNSVLSKFDDVTKEGELPMDTKVDVNLVGSPVREVHAESVAFRENQNSFGFRMNGEIGCIDGQNDGIIPENKSNGCNISGVKRARRTYDVEHASVHVAYNFLMSASKQKLKELLQKGSEWHSQHGYSTQDADGVLKSGEETQLIEDPMVSLYKNHDSKETL